MAVKEFTTAAERATRPEGAQVTFKIDGVDYTANEPDPMQVAMLMAAFGRYSTEPDQIAGVIDFFVGVLEPDSHRRIVQRLLDPRDPFGLEQVQEIMKWMLEMWAGRPTGSPSVSTQ